MRHKITVYLLTLLFSINSQANDYEKAWEVLNRNDRTSAKRFLEKAMLNPTTARDAFLTYVTILTFESKTDSITNFAEQIYKLTDDPFPYIYAFWFNNAALGDYGKKTKKEQLDLLNRLINDPGTHGSIRAAAHYVKGFHYIMSDDIKNAKKEYKLMGGIDTWQFTGPFENVSQNSFYKIYEPFANPKREAWFKSCNDYKISWFEPLLKSDEGWVPVCYNFENKTAIVFAQTFVECPDNRLINFCAGGSGSVRIWLNDQLIINEPKERTTELDFYNVKISLKTGYNRILVQLGFTNNDFPNFLIRLNGDNFEPMKDLRYDNQYHPYPVESDTFKNNLQLHFAEKFFLGKIKNESGNLINYLLLIETYLRNKKLYEARKIIEEALKIAPDNSLFHYELIQCFDLAKNDTRLSQEIERIKTLDPKCFFVYLHNIEKLKNEKKFKEAFEMVSECELLFGPDERWMEEKINLSDAQSNREEMLRYIKEAYSKYPNYQTFATYMFIVKKDFEKDSKGALKIYENFLKSQFSAKIRRELYNEYFNLGMYSKGLKELEKLIAIAPYDTDLINELGKHYFNKQLYDNAATSFKNALSQSPYHSTYWNYYAITLEQQGKIPAAIAAYKKALSINSNLYSSWEKIRQLEKLPSLWNAFPVIDIYKQIKDDYSHDQKFSENFKYLLLERQVILYPGGGYEEIYFKAIKINNQDGFDYWKEIRLPKGDNLIVTIETMETVKKDGSRINAEINENEIVFTNLEISEIIVIKYKVQNYRYGKLGKNYYDQFNFNTYCPIDFARFSLLVPKEYVFNYKVVNGEVKPVKSDYGDDFNLYSWDTSGMKAIESEPFMPKLSDVGIILHVSSILSWHVISEWYSDLSFVRATHEDYELKELFTGLFPEGKDYSESEKVKIIYDFIIKNIQYSFVSFRQSAYTPQPPSKTIVTRLGDCKDLSTLFVALARMAGLKANLVLLDHRNNGVMNMILPSVEFNHCIAKVYNDGKENFVELTDNKLPYGSLPDNILGAAALNIPYAMEKSLHDSLFFLNPVHTANKNIRKLEIKVYEKNFEVQAFCKRTGNLTASLRNVYLPLSNEKQKEKMEKSFTSIFKNGISMKELKFMNLEKTDDSVDFSFSCTILNEVMNIDDKLSFRIPFFDEVATLVNFVKNERKTPVEYWRYENTEIYESIYEFFPPIGKKFTKLPENKQLSFNGSAYSLIFQLQKDGSLIINRRADINRNNVHPQDYSAFKNFMNNIVNAESVYLLLK